MTATKTRTTEASMMLRPLDDRVIVRPDARQEVSKGGILLPDSVKEKPTVGVVVAVGPGKFCAELCNNRDPLLAGNGRAPMAVEVGDRVIYSAYSGWEVPGHKDLTILRVDDILAVDEERE